MGIKFNQRVMHLMRTLWNTWSVVMRTVGSQWKPSLGGGNSTPLYWFLVVVLCSCSLGMPAGAATTPQYQRIYTLTTQSMALPIGLLSALCFNENQPRNPSKINYNDGGGNSRGLCQIKLTTARFVGYRGSAQQLLQPEINILYAAKYLRYQLDRYHDVDKAIKAYNRGHCSGSTNCKYVRDVHRAWKEKR